MGNVTLRKKKLKDGKVSLYLDYWPPIVIEHNGQATRREFLKLYIYPDTNDPLIKKENRSALELAKAIRAKRLVQIRNQEYGFKEARVSFDLVDYYQEVVQQKRSQHSLANYKAWKASTRYLIKFFGKSFEGSALSNAKILKYREFLLYTANLRINKRKLARNTAVKYFNFFLSVLHKAYEDEHLDKDISLKIAPIKEEETHREYLTIEEIKTLWNTPIEPDVIKHICIFSAMTGLRYSDVSKITYEDLRKDNEVVYIKLTEKKTRNSYLHPIPQAAFEIIQNQPAEKGLIFTGFSYSQVARKIKPWIKDAGIDKDISFHNFRHSYATLQLAAGTDIYTVSKLLGHKNLATTQIYTKVQDQNRVKAANRLNISLDD